MYVNFKNRKEKTLNKTTQKAKLVLIIPRRRKSFTLAESQLRRKCQVSENGKVYTIEESVLHYGRGTAAQIKLYRRKTLDGSNAEYIKRKKKIINYLFIS